MRSAVPTVFRPSSCISFYIPYSIVNELRIAKIDAERNYLGFGVLTVDARGHCHVRAGISDNKIGC